MTGFGDRASRRERRLWVVVARKLPDGSRPSDGAWYIAQAPPDSGYRIKLVSATLCRALPSRGQTIRLRQAEVFEGGK